MTGSRFDPAPDGHHDDLSLAELDGLTLAVPDDPRELEADRLDWLDEQGSPPVPIQPRSSGSSRTVPHPSLPTGHHRRDSRGLDGGRGDLGCRWGPLSSPIRRPQFPTSPLARVNAQAGPGRWVAAATDPDGKTVSPSTRGTCAQQSSPCCRTRARTARPGSPKYVDRRPNSVWMSPWWSHRNRSNRDSVWCERWTRLASTSWWIGSSTFADTYGSGARTLILVRDDGVVIDILDNPDVGLRLEAELLPLNSALSGKN